MKNVKIEVSGKRASGVTFTARMIAEYLESLGLTVAFSDGVVASVIVSGEVQPTPAQELEDMCKAGAAPLSILQEAHQVIYGDREKTYGDPSKNYRTIASYWNTHIKAAKSIDAGLTESDVCGMMILLKQARLANSPTHRDSLVDLAGYVGLQDRIQSQSQASEALLEKVYSDPSSIIKQSRSTQ